MRRSTRVVAAAGLMWAMACGVARSELLPFGVLDDDQTSIVYTPETGEIVIDAPDSRSVEGIEISSAASILTGQWRLSARGTWRSGTVGCVEAWSKPWNWSAKNIFVFCWEGGFGSLSVGNVARTGLSEEFIRNDLSAAGSLLFPRGPLGEVDLVYRHDLFAGDADRDFSFDQQDIARVLQSGKYLTGQPATWGEGDWNGAPGGYPGEPPEGDGLFDQKDIVAALQTDTYLSGAYAAIRPSGIDGDEQISVVYNPNTGEIAVDAPASNELTWIQIDSKAGVFTERPECEPPGASFDNSGCTFPFAPSNESNSHSIFKGIFGGSFRSISFGTVAQTGLAEAFVLNDLSVAGSLAGGGDTGQVDLIYVPEPSTLLLLPLGLIAVCVCRFCAHAKIAAGTA